MSDHTNGCACSACVTRDLALSMSQEARLQVRLEGLTRDLENRRELARSRQHVRELEAKIADAEREWKEGA